MDFARYIKDSWKRHGDEPAQVFDAFPVGRACAQNARDLVAWAGLVAHVSGEHLGRWNDGIAVLDGVLADPYLLGEEASLRSVQRSRALLYFGSGDRKYADRLLEEYSDTDWPAASSRVRMLANAATAFAALGDVDRARSTFEEAIEVGARWWQSSPDRVLLDPPRSGAERVLEALREPLPERIVYVSCNPQSFARDARLLVREKGYRLTRAGIVDMFPHTAHSESLAVFDRCEGPVRS